MKAKARMKKLMVIATIVSLVLLTPAILAGPLHVQGISVVSFSEPLYAMKTLANGQFYIPTVPTIPRSLKIEEMFDDPHLVGDQAGNASLPYLSIAAWPDAKVDAKDIVFVASHFGTFVGSSNWDYLADVLGNQKVDGRDIIAVVRDFGHAGTYLTGPMANVTVSFNGNPEVHVDPSYGNITIPGDATSFTVYFNHSPIGALVTFWP